MHHGPLWQFFLSTFIVLFAAQRAAMAYLELASGAWPPLGLAYGLQALAAAVVAVGIWRGARWVLGWVVALGLLVAFSQVLSGLALGEAALVAGVVRAIAAVLVAGGLYLFLNREFRVGESNADRARRDARDPRRRP